MANASSVSYAATIVSVFGLGCVILTSGTREGIQPKVGVFT